MKTLISIVGTTGIGKTQLAIQLANTLQTEIISCDSRQFFRELRIGVATPTETELAQAKHHFIGNLSVVDYYSIGKYEIEALEVLNSIFKTKDQAILVGGSMMYEKALISGLNDLPEANEANLIQLQQILQNKGIVALQKILQNIDNEYFEKVDINNPRRLIRAIDVIWQTQQKYSELIAVPNAKRSFRTIRIGIHAPREIIYEKINQRVDGMMKIGLLEEVKSLLAYQDKVALKTVGYTELFHYINGNWDLDFAISEIKKNTRRFAKRQLTWYRNENDIFWVDYQNAFQQSLEFLNTLNFQ